MSTTALDILIRAKDEASRALRGVGTEVSTTAGKAKAGSSVMTRFGAAAKIAGAAVAGGLGLALKTGYDETKDYSDGLAQLQAGLKSTHGVSGMTAQGMETLASQIQDYSGQTDDSIVATEKLLLTFTNIRNQAGKNNDIFTQTTKIAADMAARMGTDASSAAIQLGKALNDPVKGITALTRVGVSFSDQQKAQIAAMVASGNTMGAQKVILGELNKEFGGSARAAGQSLPGQLARLKRSFEDLSQQLFTAALPALKTGIGLLSGVLKFVQQNSSWLGPLAAVLGTVGGAIYVVVKATKAWTAIQAALDVLMTANPVALVVIAVVALAAALVVAYKKSATFRDIVRAVWAFLKGAFLAAFHAVGKAVQVAVAIVKGFGDALGKLKDVADRVISFIRDHWKLLAGIIATLIGGPIVGAIMLLITNFGKIKSAISAVKDFVVGKFRALISFIGSIPGRIASIGSRMWSGISSGFSAAIGAVKGIWNDFARFWNGIQVTVPGINTHIPGVGKVGGFTIGLPDLPLLADGGIATRATAAIIGEAGPEAIIPLRKIKDMLGGAGGSGPVVNVYNPVPEKASESVPKRLRELAYVHGIAW